MKLLAFVIIGILSGFCGAVIGSRYGAGNPRIEGSFQFPSIVAAYMGAVSLREGLPNPTGTVTAVLLISVIQNGLVLVGASLFIKEMILGMLMLFSITIVASMKNGNISSVTVNM
jgi:ribose/xylose/arabinose/galactoside ABC-type transport system permease subunit